MQIETIRLDTSLRTRPVLQQQAQDLPAAPVNSARPVEQIANETPASDEANREQEPSSTSSAASSANDELDTEADQLRAESDARLASILEQVQIDQNQRGLEAFKVPNRLIIFGSLEIDVLA